MKALNRQRSEMSKIKRRLQQFFKALRNHSGLIPAIYLPIFGFFAGVGNRNMGWLEGGIFGFCVMSLVWIPVLITAWQKPDVDNG